jgi:hypothetical protein
MKVLNSETRMLCPYLPYGNLTKQWVLRNWQSLNNFPSFHYRVHNNSPLVPILSQMNPVHNFPSYFSHCNIPPSTPRSSIQAFRRKCFITFPISPMRAGCPANLILLDLITLTTFGEAPRYAVYLSLPSLPSLQHPGLKHPQSTRVYPKVSGLSR